MASQRVIQRPAFLALAGVAILVVLAGIYLVFSGKSNDGAGKSTSGLDVFAVGAMANFTFLEPGDPVLDVKFHDEAGDERDIAEWRGKMVLVNIWATWCGPCRHEMPALDRLQEMLGGDDFEVLALSIDRGGMDLPRAFYVENGIEQLALYNDATARAGVALGVFGIPTTVLLDRKGRLIGRLVGPAEWDDPAAVALVQATLAVPD